jgi:small GTP-binding protein
MQLLRQLLYRYVLMHLGSMAKRKFIRKVCLLGDGGVGKTSLIRRYVFDSFSDEYLVSFGTKVTKNVIELGDTELTLMIWDILGQQSQKSLHAAYYSGANGALVVGDLTRESTLRHLPEWAEDFRRVVGDKPIIPLANKSDLDGQVGSDVLQEVSTKLDLEIRMTSAKSGAGVMESFADLGKKILEVRT